MHGGKPIKKVMARSFVASLCTVRDFLDMVMLQQKNVDKEMQTAADNGQTATQGGLHAPQVLSSMMTHLCVPKRVCAIG